MPLNTSKTVSSPVVIVRRRAKKTLSNPFVLHHPPLAPPSAVERDVQPQPDPAPHFVATAVPKAMTTPAESSAPETALLNRRRRDAQAKWALLAVLQERWPRAFPRQVGEIRPLAVGIHKAIAAALPGTPLWHIKGAIALFQRLHHGAY